MDDLVTFLRARLDEDEAAAKDERVWFGPYPQTIGEFEGHLVIQEERVLREVAAKRAILERHGIAVTKIRNSPYDPDTGERRPEEYNVDCAICGWVSGNPGDACETVCILAAVYSGHPDYRPEWKPQVSE